VAEVRIVNLLKQFGDLNAVDKLNYTFEDGKVTCLLGPSGCGKTTLLRMIAGLLEPTSGSIFFGDWDVTDVPTPKRKIGMVFQYPVVYRGLTTYQNIELPLLNERLTKGDIKQRVNEAIALLQLEKFTNTDISALNSVIKQKVAVARAVARRPEIILFDEPLTNVDASSKTQFKRSFKELTQHLKQTIVYVTHDQTEAMTFADYIALMLDGKVVQFDHPRHLYMKPQDKFGGWFLGNPGMNFIDANVEKKEGARFVSNAFLSSEVKQLGEEEKTVTIGIRPERIKASQTQTAGKSVPAKLIRKYIACGGQYLLLADVEGKKIKIKTDSETGKKITDSFFLSLSDQDVLLYDSKDKQVEL
jgi:ABC-type sugar transport system ATPase subunit